MQGQPRFSISSAQACILERILQCHLMVSTQHGKQQLPVISSVVGTATPELVFTATTDAAKWVQIYGLLRPTDANDLLLLGVIKLDKFRNENIREQLSMNEPILQIVQHRQNQWLGSVFRMKDDRIAKNTLVSRTEGMRRVE